MSFLTLQAVKRRYGSATALDGVDLEVKAGGRTAIVGPSGCGKTTLLRLIAGFDMPDSGVIVLNGRLLAEGPRGTPAHLRGVGVVAQDGALFPHLSVADNIGFGLARSDPARNARIADLAASVGLDAALLRRSPHELSGGQQQRVALARAIAIRPRLMLLDEPFSSLDTGLRAAMRRTVAELLEKAGVTAILVTHDQAEALSFADQVAVMEAGKFSQVGAPRDLYMRPRDRMVAEFLGDAIFLTARVADGFALTPLGRVALDAAVAGETAHMMLRPEQVSMRAAGDTDAPPDSVLARVTKHEFAGGQSTVEVQPLENPGDHESAIFVLKAGVNGPEAGDIVRLTVTGTAHVLPPLFRSNNQSE